MCVTRTAPVRPAVPTPGGGTPAWISLILVLLMTPFFASAASFVDPLDEVSAQMHDVTSKPLRDIVVAGERLVAVGDNGLIIYSDDHGQTWLQAAVPVSTDLNAVFFSDPLKGWAVGHGAAILHSTDGGKSWVRQLDGRTLEALFVDYFEHRSGLDTERAQSYLSALLSMTRPGPGQFFMGVWFDKAGTNGYAVGPFGLILGTQDGGKTWQPGNTSIDNDDLLHLTGVRQIEGALYITGERGRVWHLDQSSKRFVMGEVGYDGTLFGITGRDSTLLAYGLRGHVFRSINAGRSWASVSNDFAAGITAGTAVDGSGLVLVSQAAQVAISRDEGTTFELLDVPRPTLYTGVVSMTGGQLAMVGLNGVTTLQIQ